MGAASHTYGGQAGYDQSGYGAQAGYGSATDLGTKAAGALTGYEGSGWGYHPITHILRLDERGLYCNVCELLVLRGAI